MLTKEQVQSIIEAAKADDAAEKIGALAGTMIQAAADVVVAEELLGIKKNRAEFKADLDKYTPLGKPDEIRAAAEELATLRAAKGKKPDQKELEVLAQELTENRVATFRAEQKALMEGVQGESDGFKATGEKLHSALLAEKRKAELLEHAGPGLKGLMSPFYLQRLGPMLQPVESDNGAAWWEKDVTSWRVVDPGKDNAPLVGKGGALTTAELVESGRLGLGDKEWNSREFADTFFEKTGKGGGYVAPGGMPTTPTGHVDPGAPAYAHFEALHGTES